jgi:hypothetical protein
MPRERKVSPKTRPMPLADSKEFVSWVQEQKTPKKLDDEGAAPPAPKQKLKEPREPGTKEKTKGGDPT